MTRVGFTLTELLVSFAIMGLLVALLMPAVQASREAARSAQCRSNLHEIGIALQNYESSYGMLPACGIKKVSWQVAVLPYLEQTALFHRVDFSQQTPTTAIADSIVSVYLCSSDSAPRIFQGENSYGATSYLGNSGTGVLEHGYDGIFRHFTTTFPEHPEGSVRFADVTDGLSNTAATSEVLHSLGGNSVERLRVVWNTPRAFLPSEVELFRVSCASIPADPSSLGWHGSPISHGWRWVVGDVGYSTYNHALTPMQPSCFNGTEVQTGIFSAASAHRSSVNVLFCDGHVTSKPTSIDATVWAQFGSRNGSETSEP